MSPAAPSADALAIASLIVNNPWEPLFDCPFVLSEQDRINGNYPKGDYTFTDNITNLALHLYKEWPGA